MVPCIAIIDSNTLSTMALTGILWDMFPSVEIVTFGTMEDFFADCNRYFVHYFISDDIMLGNASEFDMLRHEVIVMSKGTCPSLSSAGYKVLDVSLGEADLVREIFRFHIEKVHHDPLPKPETGVLSDREKEVLALIVKGKLNKEIADELSISQATAIFHRNNVCSKLGTRSIGKLTILALLSGIVSLKEL